MIDMSIYGEMLFSYQGSGQLRFFDNEVYECSFEAAQFADGTIRMKCQIKVNWLFPPLESGNIDFRGTTNDGKKLSIQGPAIIQNAYSSAGQEGRYSELLFITYGDAKMSFGEPTWENKFELRFGLTNFTFIGDKFTKEDGQLNRNTLQLEIGDTAIIIRQLSDYKKRVALLEARSGISVTSEAILEIQDFDEIDSRKDLIQTLSDMLSLARGTSITSSYMKIFNNETCIYVESWNHSKGGYSGARPIIDAESFVDTKKFIESTHNRFVDLSPVYNLVGIIQLLMTVRSKGFIEVQGITLGSLVDYITGKFTITKNEQYIIDDEIFTASKKDLRKAIIPIILDTFKENIKKPQAEKMALKVNGFNYPDNKVKLSGFCKEFHAPIQEDEITNFVKNRDNLTHYVRFTTEDKFKDFFSMLHFVDKLLLSMLQYEGSYMNVTTSPSTKEDFRLTS